MKKLKRVGQVWVMLRTWAESFLKLIVLVALIALLSWTLYYLFGHWNAFTARQRSQVAAEFMDTSRPMSLDMRSRASDHFSNIYTSYSAFIAAVTVVLGFITFMGWWYDYSRKNREGRDERFKELELVELAHLYEMISEYDRHVVDLKWKGQRAYKVIGALYDKYRRKELSLLLSGTEDSDTIVRLNNLDADFMRDADEAGLLEPASVLFRMLNWLYALEGFLKDTYANEKLRKGEIDRFRARLLNVISGYLTAQTKYVFGKYRHHRYHLDGEGKHYPRSGDLGYRGASYADSLFAYSRTLALMEYDRGTKVLLAKILKERYQSEGVDDSLRYFPNSVKSP